MNRISNVAVAAILGAMSPNLIAQTRAAATLEEVLVTASKRPTTLQDSDLSVTVLDAKTLDEARVRDFRRIDDLVPNVQFSASGQLSDLYISIRGVESNPFLVNRAAVYIDGIPFRELSNSVLNQVESIEVLRGPQGTLYGANSESGLVLVRTRAPRDTTERELRVTGTSFGNGHGYEADGFVGGPLRGESLSGSLAFKFSNEDSYLKNLASSTGQPGEVREGFAQGRLRWQPAPGITIDAMGYWLDTRAPGLFIYEYLPMNLDLYNSSYSQFNGGRLADKFTYFQDSPKYTDKQERVAGVSGTFNVGEGRIDAAVSYREEESDSRGYDFDITALPVISGRVSSVESFWQAEVRYTSPDDQPLEYIFGTSIYGEDEDSTLATLVGSGGLDDYVAAPVQQSAGRDYSAFVSASFTPSAMPKLTVSAGVRYDRAQRRTRQQEGVLHLGPSGVIAYRDAALRATFEAVLPRFSIRLRPSESLTLFASSAKGYIPGGFNLTAVQQGIVDDNVLRYEPESLWSHEVGFRWQNPSRDLRISGAVFHIRSDNWQEIQVATDAQGRPVTSDYVGSDASIQSQGAELEATFDATDHLQFAANIGYVDATYRDLQVDTTTNLRGNRVKLVPEIDAYFAARYKHATGWFVRGELALPGRMALDERNRAMQPATTLLGLQIGIERDRWSARAFGENLANKRRFNGIALTNLAFGEDGNRYGPVDPSRIVGLEIEAQW